jgi:hypothetical protein
MNRNIMNNICWIGGLLASVLLWFPFQSMAHEWPKSKASTTYTEETWESYGPLGGTELRKTTHMGLDTVLEVYQKVARIPRHDIDMGMTKLIMYSRDNKKVLLTEVFTDVWECLGFNMQTRKYLIIAKSEHGVKITLRGLLYIDERKAVFQGSVFGKQCFEATASLYSPDGNYLALIGAPEGRDMYGLYVFNTISDQLQEIGEPPAPPPLAAEDLEYPDAEDMRGPWEAPERHYTELEKEIWEFMDPHTLRVSYGKDSLKHRSKDRTIKEWDLRTVFRQSIFHERSVTQP